MNQILPSSDDDFSQIETMLGQINPEPGERFYTKIQSAPWMQGIPVPRKKHKVAAFPIKRFAFSMVFVFVIIALAGILFFPSVRAIARQLFNAFVSTPSNQLEVTLTSTNPDELFHDADPAHFALSIQEAADQAGFDVLEIHGQPEDLKFVGAHFDSSYSAVTSLYQGSEYRLFLTQHPLDGGRDEFTIGPEAQIQLVDIDGHPGEWVTGGWKAITVTESPALETKTSITAIWDNDLPQSTLRWQFDDTMFELRSIGVERLSQTEMINLANELK